MSHWTREVELVGKREFFHDWYNQVTCPTNRKYITCIGDWLTPDMMNAIINEKGGAFNASGQVIQGTDGAGYDEEYLPTGTTTAGTSISPIKIKDGKIFVRGRNNGLFVVDVTLFNIAPKNIVTDVITGITTTAQTHATNMAMFAVLEGIGDKVNLAAAVTEGVCMVHTTATTGLKSMRDEGVSFNELSLHPSLTIYDSGLFGTHFSVKNQYNMTLKPGDEFEINFNMPDMSFLDGVEIYRSTELIGYDFSRFIWMQVVGHLASTAYNTPGLEAAASPTTARAAAKKQELVGTVGYSKGYVDVAVVASGKMEVFTGTLIEPLTSMTGIKVTIGANNLNESLLQTVHDVN